MKITWVQQRQHHRVQESARERMLSLALILTFLSSPKDKFFVLKKEVSFGVFTTSSSSFFYFVNSSFAVLSTAQFFTTVTHRQIILLSIPNTVQTMGVLDTKNFRRLGRSTGSGGGRKKAYAAVNDIDISRIE